MCCKTARTNTKTIVQEQNDFRTVAPKRLLQLSAAGEVFLEGTCPLSRCPQTAKLPAPLLLGARRRWVRKATAFRGRSEQDRSALCAACSTMILKTFRWNVFNEISLCRNRRTRHAVSLLCTKLFSAGSALSELSRNSVGKTTAIKEGKNHDRHQMDPE